MEKKPLNTAQNALYFLNSLTYKKLQEIGIKDRVAIVLWSKKFIKKHQLIKVVQDKSNAMSSQINDFKRAFKELFEDDLPSFWDNEGRLFSQEHYHSLLVQNRMDHSKFEDLVKGLTGKINVEKLIEDFEVLQKFLIIRRGFPTVYYEAYVDLEVSIREMTEYDTPNTEQWRIVEIFGKTKYILHP